ncbi:cyclopropane-fatty-acyl-phospholipid synthase [Methylophilus rhizosphaerae]|uniref:sphingolipid C(9)-methyltransferase n=1 Tax=Methylophilus rhizosphaerae TaxID=492660 RepID=A0A1G9EQ96_9PROT|nr:cyclopropane-fatty-acyl-phospholipid synthase family protein [Methylophilus rhizosphaerae]SDK78326.1 cyclopropane-fatty-acyl-phospholipid synthase [Methylophilus rhizosphaerae]
MEYYSTDNMQPGSMPAEYAWPLGAVEERSSTLRAHAILNRLFQGFPDAFAIRLWNGGILSVGEGAPAFTFCLEQAPLLRDMGLFIDPMRLVEAYIGGEVQILGDFNAAMRLLYHFESLALSLHEKLGMVFRALMLAEQDDDLPAYPENATPPQSTYPATTLNYEAPAGFYRLWLGKHMLHACAYFGDARQDLAQAQHNQLDLVCLKLHLQHGDHLLDIGGWGEFACWAARHYGALVHSLTSSPAQYADAVAEVKRQRLEKQVRITLGDYRELQDIPCYDKVANTAIPSHVGRQHLPAYLAKMYNVLKPGGLLLHHGVTSESPGWQHEISTALINQQVFPDGELATLPQLQQAMQTAKFEILSVEGLRRHQALTLHRWLENLEQHHSQVTALAGERTYRLWRLCMAACAIQFEQGVTGIHQMLVARH